MAESDAEKTEMPTPKRLQRARSEGNVVKTMELNSAVILLSGTILLNMMMGKIMQSMIYFFHAFYGEIPTFEFTVDNFHRYFVLGCTKIALILAPFLLTIMVVGILINIIQSGWIFSAKTLTPKLSRLNPLNGFSRFFSSRAFVDLLKNVVKVSLVGLVAYWTISADFEEFVPLLDKSIGQIIIFLGHIAFKVAMRTSLMILIIAILDYIWVRYKYIKDLKMTKQEVKEEHRQAEGPPEVKSAIRRIQLRTAINRMMSQVPSAEVVITNPTHYAVALKYESGKMDAPIVLAKGARKIALKIRQIAEEHNIPIVENPPLARSLYHSVDIGKMISPEFYAAVAEVLAYIYKLKGRKAA